MQLELFLVCINVAIKQSNRILPEDTMYSRLKIKQQLPACVRYIMSSDRFTDNAGRLHAVTVLGQR